MKLLNAFKNQMKNEINNEFYSSEYFDEYCSLNCYINDFQREKYIIESVVRELIGNLSETELIRVEDSYALLIKTLKQLESSVLKNFQIDCVLFMIGDGSIDSHGMVINGESILVIDLIAYSYGFEKYNPVSFLVHEAFHAHHYKLKPDFYFKNFTKYKETVFKRIYCEGLATYATRVLTTESDADIFWLGYLKDEDIKRWIDFAEESKQKYVNMNNCEELSPSDKIRLFSVVDMEKLHESRIGYYYGYKISEIIGCIKSLEELVTTDFEEIEIVLNDYISKE